ncbi:MAG: Conserved hypothetical periplasmic protein [Candidatus Moranbacteria bacterium GW2011_GWE1_49_15]|nr:MAG: Conserved hypothetical periplasmic protein [Candidatus Moranbacteria bacterium GW2011_GWE1_49_15]HBP01317.1 hypothetical protein [Candidatus Moranbacteria bacterium]
MKTKLKKLSYWAGVSAVGIVLGLSLQFTRAWVEPTVAPPGGNIGAPINTGNVSQTKNGFLGAVGMKSTSGLEVGNAGNAYTYLTLRDDESPNGVKYIHANSNVVGFLNGAGNWINYWGDNGDSYQVGNANANDVYIRAAGKWASQLGGGTSAWSQSGTTVYYNGGNVGIGTASPGAKLDVQGNVKMVNHYFDANDDGWLRLRNGDNGSYKDLAVGNMWVDGTLNIKCPCGTCWNTQQFSDGNCGESASICTPAGWRAVYTWQSGGCGA